MVRLKPILEPGERVLAQDPGLGVMWFVRACGAMFVGLWAWLLLDGDMVGMIFMMFFIVFLFPSQGLFLWQGVLTDRRLIYRADNKAGYVAVPLAEIEVVQERDPEEFLASPSRVARKMVRLVGKARIMDNLPGTVAVGHGKRAFGFEVGKRKAALLHEVIAEAKGEARDGALRRNDRGEALV